MIDSMKSSATEQLAQEFENEFISHLSPERRREIIHEIVESNLRSGKVTPSAFEQLVKKMMYQRLEHVAAEDFRNGIYDQRLSDLFSELFKEFVKVAAQDPTVRHKIARGIHSFISRLGDLDFG